MCCSCQRGLASESHLWQVLCPLCHHQDGFPLYLPHSRADGGALHLVHVGHQGVSWVRDDRTEDAGNVSCSKCDHQLLRLAALVSWLRHHIGIDRLHSSLETGKLHHGVGNLTTPQGNEGLVETWTLQLFNRQMDPFEITIETLSAVKGGRSTPQSGGESAQL